MSDKPKITDRNIDFIQARSSVNKDGCWVWQLTLTKNGHGGSHINGKRITAHELSYRIAIGNVPNGMRVFAICGNRSCVNPSHLSLCLILGKHTHDPDYIKSMVLIDESDCWNWTGSLNPNGYGRIAVGRGNVLMHRASWEVFRGDIPDNLYVLHKCDNRKCVNPDHLFLGSLLDNNRDARDKMRAFTDGRHFNARLTVDQVKAILSDKNSSNKALSSVYGVTSKSIRLIRNRTRWSHINV